MKERIIKVKHFGAVGTSVNKDSADTFIEVNGSRISTKDVISLTVVK